MLVGNKSLWLYLTSTEIRRYTSELATCKRALSISLEIFWGFVNFWLWLKACLFKWGLDKRITKYRKKFLEPRWRCSNNFWIPVWLSEGLANSQFKDTDQCHKEGDNVLVIYKQVLNVWILKLGPWALSREIPPRNDEWWNQGN